MPRVLSKNARSPSYPLKGSWKTIQEICKQLGLGRDWVERRLADGRFKPALRVSEEQPFIPQQCYSPECQRWLEQQAKAFRQILPMGSHVPLHQAAVRLGCSRVWIRTTLKDKSRGLGMIVKRRSDNNRLVDCISSRTFQELRKMRAGLAPVDRATASQLSQLTGWRPSTVVTRLRHMATEPYIAGDGRVRDHYLLAEAVQALGVRSKADISPAGDWLTAHRMGMLLGRTWDWMTPRLALPHIQAARRWMQDDSFTPQWHYPPWVFRALEAQSEAEKSRKAVS